MASRGQAPSLPPYHQFPLWSKDDNQRAKRQGLERIGKTRCAPNLYGRAEWMASFTPGPGERIKAQLLRRCSFCSRGLRLWFPCLLDQELRPTERHLILQSPEGLAREGPHSFDSWSAAPDLVFKRLLWHVSGDVWDPYLSIELYEPFIC